MNFEREFENWLSTALQVPVPEEVKAFSFNLFEPAGEEEVKFGIELIGAGNYDPDDSDWACEEVWEPKQRRLFIPLAYSGTGWEGCLEKMKILALKLLKSDKKFVEKLTSRQGIGIGFVDGDLEIIWQP